MITAFRIEAEPFIDYFGAVEDGPGQGYRFYRSEHAVIGVCGPGKRRAAILTRHLISDYAGSGGRDRWPWLNFGIAGSGSHECGALVCASTVVDAVSGKVWSLPTWKFGDIPRGTIETVPQPAEDYREEILYDMESSGIIAALSEHSALRRTAVVKLVSDGPGYPVRDLGIQRIVELIGQSESRIHALLDEFLIHNQAISDR